MESQRIQNAGIFNTLVHSEPEAYAEPWHIQIRGIFRTLGYSELEANSELCQTSTMERGIKVVNIYSYQLFLFFNLMKVFLAAKVFVLCKKSWWPRRLGAMNFDISTLCCNFLFIIA